MPLCYPIDRPALATTAAGSSAAVATTDALHMLPELFSHTATDLVTSFLIFYTAKQEVKFVIFFTKLH